MSKQKTKLTDLTNNLLVNVENKSNNDNIINNQNVILLSIFITHYYNISYYSNAL